MRTKTVLKAQKDVNLEEKRLESSKKVHWESFSGKCALKEAKNNNLL